MFIKVISYRLLVIRVVMEHLHKFFATLSGNEAFVQMLHYHPDN